ncbi:hypothetical protein D3C78_1352700 [compost metagenome]
MASTIFSATVSTVPRTISGLSSVVVSRPTIIPSALRAAGISPLRSSTYTAIPASFNPLEAMVVEINHASAIQTSQGEILDSSHSRMAVSPQAPPATHSGSNTPALRRLCGLDHKRRIARSRAVIALPIPITGWGKLRGSPTIRSIT